jgi:hypothetical protein
MTKEMSSERNLGLIDHARREGKRAARRHQVQVAAILLAAIMVASVLVVLTYSVAEPRPAAAKPTAEFGPRLSVTETDLAPAVTAAETSTASQVFTTLQVFAAIPNAFTLAEQEQYNLSTRNASSNGVYDELLNVTFVNTSATLFLPFSFNTAASEWADYFHALDTGVNDASLAVYATQSVVVGSEVAVYQFSTNIPYNPTYVPTVTLNSTGLASTAAASWFNGSDISPTQFSSASLDNMSFGLPLNFPATPAAIVPLADFLASSQGADASSFTDALSPAATPGQTEWVYTYGSEYHVIQTTFLNGTLPLIVVNIGDNANGTTILNSWASINVESDWVNLTSTAVSESSGGLVTTQMSTSPSYAHLQNLEVGVSGDAAGAVPIRISLGSGANLSEAQNHTTGYIGLQSAEFEFVVNNLREYRYYSEEEYECHQDGSKPVCYWEIIQSDPDGSVSISTTTTGAILNVASSGGSIAVSYGYLTSWEWLLFQDLFGAHSNGTVELTSSGTDSSWEAATVWGNVYGYSSASSDLAGISDALSTFSDAMDVGLALSDALAAANGADLDTSEGAVIADSLDLIAGDIGLTADIVSQFSSIGYVSGSNSVSIGYGFSALVIGNPPSSYNVAFYEAASPVTFSGSAPFYPPCDLFNATSIAS